MVENIKIANLLNKVIVAKNKNKADPKVVLAPLTILIPKSLNAT